MMLGAYVGQMESANILSRVGLGSALRVGSARPIPPDRYLDEGAHFRRRPTPAGSWAGGQEVLELRRLELAMPLPVILLLEGLVYAVIFSGLALVRQEKLSLRLVFESLLITLAVSGVTALSGYPTHPVLFLFVVYLLTMRVRLLVDVGNSFARRGRYPQAEALYGLVDRLWPDPVGKIILDLNRGAMLLQRGKTDEAIAALTSVLEKSREGNLGPRHEAAAHYNLGAAYRRKGVEARAIREFNEAVDAWPASPYARRAEEALGQNRPKPKGTPPG